MKNIKYMHTIANEPASYDGKQICYAVVTRPIKLADSLDQIRREQRASRADAEVLAMVLEKSWGLIAYFHSLLKEPLNNYDEARLNRVLLEIRAALAAHEKDL